MAQRVVQDLLCDRHWLLGEEVAGETTPPISIGKAAPRKLELCVECKTDLLDPLAQLLQAQGHLNSESRPSVAPAQEQVKVVELETLYCEDCGRTDFKNAAGLGSHRTRKHPPKGRKAKGN